MENYDQTWKNVIFSAKAEKSLIAAGHLRAAVSVITFINTVGEESP